DVQGQLWYVRDLKNPATDAGRGRVYDHLRAAVASACETSQVDRLDNLLLHLVGWRAVRLEQYASRLEFSDGQLSRISKLIEPSPESPANAALTPQQLKALEAVLKPEQQRTVSQLLGPDFDLSQLPSRYCPAPALADIAEWINSDPLTLEDLHGKVVVVHFWTFGCINCIRNIPHYEGWYQKYLGRDVVIVGIHTPETEGERDLAAVRSKVAEYKMQYPVAVDGKGATWTAWANAWWPSVYLVDKRGYVRDWWYGELNWQDAKGEEHMRRRIDALLAEE
ncbi:MAG: redoxin domain-containing protein, partial [Planctomycetaceae bacterium]|nr:redoxin domain-containing protein [Planctomycetaceae bacterium]